MLNGRNAGMGGKEASLPLLAEESDRVFAFIVPLFSNYAAAEVSDGQGDSSMIDRTRSGF